MVLMEVLTSQATIPADIITKPFDLPDVKTGRHMSQSIRLTDFEGATIVLDLRARGSPQKPDLVEFECRLRIKEISKSVPATALEDLVVKEEQSWRKEIEQFTVPQIMERLRDNGDDHCMQGMTRRDDLLAALRLSEERRRPVSKRVVVRAGLKGVVVKPRYLDNRGEWRIVVCFQDNLCMHVYPNQVELGEPVPSSGQKPIGEGSTYQVTGGSITFGRRLMTDDHPSSSDELEYFVGSSPVPAAPGVLVPWRKAFVGGHARRPCLFKTTESVECRAYAKLDLSFVRHSGSSDLISFETPEPKTKRMRAEL